MIQGAADEGRSATAIAQGAAGAEGVHGSVGTPMGGIQAARQTRPPGLSPAEVWVSEKVESLF